jgi:protein arginine kinase
VTTAEGGDAWYTASGPDDDVVLSTRLRLARNLVNFPFPAYERGDDGERVLSLVFDSFAHLRTPDDYQTSRVDRLAPLRKKLLFERGFIPSLESNAANLPPVGIVLKTDGRIVCTVNDTDHIRLAAFASGLDTERVWQLCRDLDSEMQKSLQFAAAYETGFLTSSLFDAGSGMRVSAHVHLAATELAGNEELLAVLTTINDRGFTVEHCFGPGAGGLPLGSYYRIRNMNSFDGSEFDQIASLAAVTKYVIDMERNFRSIIAQNMPTTLRNRVYRAFAAVKYGRFMDEAEAIGLISDIGLGKDTGLITGVEYSALSALFYRIKDAHLELIIRSGNFAFEGDVEASDALKVKRMRALIVQEALENAGIA